MEILKQMSSSRNKIIVVCSYCHRIIKGQWTYSMNGEEYDQPRISHGICPECLLLHFPDEYLLIQEKHRVEMINIFEKSCQDFYAERA